MDCLTAKKACCSDVYFNLYNDSTIEQAKQFLEYYPYFADCFTAIELHNNFVNRS